MAHKNKKGSNIGAAVVGAAVGAAATTAALVLTDEKKRKALKANFDKALAVGEEKLKQAQKRLEEMRKRGEQLVGEIKRVLIWFLAAAVVLFTPLPGGVNPAENAQEWCRLEDLSVSLLPCEGWFM